MKQRWIVAVLVAGLLAFSAAPALADSRSTGQILRAAALDSPSVVMVYYSASAMLQDSRDGSIHGRYDVQRRGTGFFVGGDGYIVTAADVAALPQDDLRKMLVETYLAEDAKAAGCEAAGSCIALEDSHRTSYQEATSLVDPHVDVRVLTQDMDTSPATRARAPAAEVRAVSPPSQHDTVVLKIPGRDEPILPLADSSGVHVKDQIAILGYPGAAETDPRTIGPTVTTGVITGKSRGPEAGVAAGVNLFQTQAGVEPGGSGAPAIDTRGHVVGLVSYKSNATRSLLISSSDIRDIVDQSGAHNSLGRIDQLWREGLGYMDQHRYARAMAAFDQCSTLNKAQVGCISMSRKATRLLGQDEEWRFAWWRTLPAPLLAGLATLALMLGLTAAAVLLWLRRRRTAPGGVPGEGVVAPADPQLPPG